MNRILLLACLCATTLSTAALASDTCRPETADLAKKATVQCADARKTALARVPGGKIVSSELEQENGKLIYSFDVRTKGKSGIDEVHVDAKTGEVMAVDHENAAAEQKEKKQDAAEHAASKK